MSMASVAAAVVTYNRRELLLECVDAVLAQTHPVQRLFVVDNASTDGTEQHVRARGALDGDGVEYVRLDHNAGGAGGFAEAVRLAREAGCDWIWLMDDDSEPLQDSLHRLLEST